ncbi:MAG TPA: hypothetical protein ENI87_02500 [bacterium]|nr:hypothetical protein [bacterium]
MHLRKHTDTGFDDFYRERKRVRAKLGPQKSVLGYENQALKELEQVEEREVREQQLTREVHDFFAAATRQAAAIVEKVSHDAEREASERLQGEVEGFLIDALSRMNNFIVTVMQKRRNANVAETQIEPDVKHLVGSELDEFRLEGSGEARDAHLGKDPFDTSVEEVQREFRAVVADGEEEEPAASIDEHLVAEALSEETDETEHAGDATHSEADASVETETTPEEELEAFKSALKALVRQGVMQKDEARAAFKARLEALGRA